MSGTNGMDAPLHHRHHTSGVRVGRTVNLMEIRYRKQGRRDTLKWFVLAAVLIGWITWPWV